jgi:hypothetical protein
VRMINCNQLFAYDCRTERVATGDAEVCHRWVRSVTILESGWFRWFPIHWPLQPLDMTYY